MAKKAKKEPDFWTGAATFSLLSMIACVMLGIYLVSIDVLPKEKTVEKPTLDYYEILQANVGQTRAGKAFTMAAVKKGETSWRWISLTVKWNLM